MESREEMTIITGGHFMINKAGKPVLNKGTIKSFEQAVNFYKKGIKNSVLGILINDIGATCGQEKCLITNTGKFSRDSFALLPEYRNILQKNGLSAEDLQIYWEKQMRNKAKKFFTKFYKENPAKFRKDKEYFYWENSTGKEFRISKITPNDKYGTPLCSLIMSAFYKKLEEDGFTQNFNFYYIGEDNPNILNSEVLECGHFFSELTNQEIKVENFFI